MDSDPFFTFSDDEEDEVKSIDLQCFKEAVMVFQASTSTIPKTSIKQKMIHRDRYGAHDRLVAAYFSKNFIIDCTGSLDILSLMKCIFAILQSAYDTFPDALDEYSQIVDNTFRLYVGCCGLKYGYDVKVSVYASDVGVFKRLIRRTVIAFECRKKTLVVLGSRQQLAKPLQIEGPPSESVDPPPIVEPENYGQVCEQCDAAKCFKSHAPNGSIKYSRLSKEPPKVQQLIPDAIDADRLCNMFPG
nr:hypothetical protein [Tanacetum cinerariifolium]